MSELRLNEVINKPLIVLLFLGILTFHIYSNYFPYSNEEFEIIDSIYILLPILVGLFGLWVVKNHWKTEVFGKAYAAIGIAYIMVGIGEFLYIVVYEVILQIDPYPSIADVFYLAFYPFALFHLIKNTRFFLAKITNKHIALVLSILIVTVGTYTYISYVEINELNFDFYYGLVFITGTALILSFTILGVTSFGYSKIGIIWLILLTGILLDTTADVWYHYLEIFEGYSGTHIVNTMWVASWVTIIYALYKHGKDV